MPVKMKPASVIKARLGIQPNGPAHAFFTSTCFKHMTKFVPGGTSSHLNQIITIDPDKVIYHSPGSHYLWNGILYVDPDTGSAFAKKGATKVPTNRELFYHTPGTGDHWEKRMMAAEGKQVENELQEFVNNGGKR